MGATSSRRLTDWLNKYHVSEKNQEPDHYLLRGLLQNVGIDTNVLSLKPVRDMMADALHDAVEANHTNIVTCILDSLDEGQRFHVLQTHNQQGEMPLHSAVINNSVELTKVIMESINVDLRLHLVLAYSRSGKTALSYAVTSNHCSIVRCIIKSLDVEQRYQALQRLNANGERPLHDAVSSKSMEVTKLLLQSVNLGVRYNLLRAQSIMGMTAIHYAAISNQPELVEYMLQCVYENQRTQLLRITDLEYGASALAWAAYKGHSVVTMTILHTLTSPQNLLSVLTMRAHDERTPRDLANLHGMKRVAAQLEEFQIDARIKMVLGTHDSSGKVNRQHIAAISYLKLLMLL